MENSTKIYLWVAGEGWRPFSLTDTEELKKRDISISSTAQIGNEARIGYAAQIGNEARIGKKAEISEKEVITKTLFITGSAHTVIAWKDTMQIGCQKHAIAYWLENYERIGREHGYSADQRAEYGTYIKIVATWAGINVNA